MTQRRMSMFPRTRFLMLLVLLIAVAGCSKSTETHPADTKPAASGTTSPSTATSTAAATAPGVTAPEPSQGFTLTMSGVDSYLAAIRNLAKLAEKNPAFDDLISMNASNENSTQ